MKTERTKTTLGRRVLREALSWFWLLLAFVFITGTLVQARVIPSSSMERTLLVGDHLLMSRFGYAAGIPFTDWQVPLWRHPQRQQVIVFAPPPGEGSSQDLIKRVIGVPGDRIEIRRGIVYVNGQALNEPYALRDPDDQDASVENFPPAAGDFFEDRLTPEWAAQLRKQVVAGALVVPPDRYFVLGDNRDNSYDSRYWGFVPRENIIGAPVMIYMSLRAPEDAWQPGQVRERLYAYFSALIHPRLVRWHRIFRTF